MKTRVEWYSEAEAEIAATKGRRECLRAAIIKWRQLYEACPTALSTYDPNEHMGSNTCALCIKYEYNADLSDPACNSCRLHCTDGLWYGTTSNLIRWKKDTSRRNWTKWKKACGAMLNAIECLYQKEYGKKNEPNNKRS